MAKLKKFVASGDFHYPYHHKPSVNILLDFVKDFQPDTFVFGGDQVDNDLVSHWNKKKPRKVEGKRLQKMYRSFDKEILKPIERRLSNKCKKVWLDGNHEYWIQDFLDEYPQFEGMIELEHNLNLKKRDWKYIPYGVDKDPKTTYNISRKLAVSHGWYTNKYHAAKTINMAEQSIITFHNHTNQVFTKQRILDLKDYHTCISAPCMCTRKPSYGRGRPNRWVNGFVYGYIQPDGAFTVNVVVIAKDKAIIEGQLYNGSYRK